MGAGAGTVQPEVDTSKDVNGPELRINGPLGGVVLETTAGLDWTIGDVKARLEECTGTPLGQQRLTLKRLKGPQSQTRHPTLDDAEPLSVVLPPGCSTLTLDMINRTEEQVYWLRRVHVQPASLEDAPVRIQADHEVVLLAVRQMGGALRWASTELRADKLIVMEA